MPESYLAMIASGDIDACCPVGTYLTHRFRLDIVDGLWEDVPSGDEFFLQHPDDKGDYISVNGPFDIIGAIDWEWTQTVSKAEAFCSPCMMWLVTEFYSGSNELAGDALRLAAIFRERGRKDLANCITRGRTAQKFLLALGPDGSLSDRTTFTHLVAGLQRAIYSGDEGWEHWKS